MLATGLVSCIANADSDSSSVDSGKYTKHVKLLNGICYNNGSSDSGFEHCIGTVDGKNLAAVYHPPHSGSDKLFRYGASAGAISSILEQESTSLCVTSNGSILNYNCATWNIIKDGFRIRLGTGPSLTTGKCLTVDNELFDQENHKVTVENCDPKNKNQLFIPLRLQD